MGDPRTDEGLMLAYRDGDATAFDELYARHRGRLYRYFAHQVPQQADELFQDVWMRVIHARRDYEPSARFTTWMYRIAHNRLMDHFRAGSRRAMLQYLDDPDEAEALPAPDSQEPPAIAERRQVAQRIVAAVGGLPAPQREAFLLAEEGELSLAEIARASGVSRETAKSRLRYALVKLRRALEDLR
jgi:RNA polymerase sigma-70 factor (ECF subfamily)